MISENKSDEQPLKTDSSERVLELLERTAFECLPRLERPPAFLPADQRAQYLLRQISEEFSELRQISEEFSELRSRVVDLELERELDALFDQERNRP